MRQIKYCGKEQKKNIMNLNPEIGSRIPNENLVFDKRWKYLCRVISASSTTTFRCQENEQISYLICYVKLIIQFINFSLDLRFCIC
jgi:hypothetical protein